MTINYINSTIEMSKAEAKAAGKYNSDKFKELQSLKAVEPTFRVVIVKSTAKKGDHFKGLTYDYMENYIKEHDDEGHSILTTFNKLRGLDENGQKMELATAATYGEIKMWFLAQFPEIKAMSANINNILDTVRKIAA